MTVVAGEEAAVAAGIAGGSFAAGRIVHIVDILADHIADTADTLLAGRTEDIHCIADRSRIVETAARVRTSLHQAGRTGHPVERSCPGS